METGSLKTQALPGGCEPARTVASPCQCWYLSRTVPLVAVGAAESLSPVPLLWFRFEGQMLLTAADGNSSGGSSGQPNCSLVLP